MGKKRQKRRQKTATNSAPNFLNDFKSLLADSGPLQRSWPSQAVWGKLSSGQIVENGESLTGEVNYLKALSEFYGGCINADKESVTQSVTELSKIASAYPSLKYIWSDVSWICALFSHIIPNSEAFIQQAQNANPNSAEVWVHHAIYALINGQPERMAESLDRAASLHPNPSLKQTIEQLKADEKLSYGSGILFESVEFGNLHHPPVKPKEIHLFKTFLLSNLCEQLPDNTDLLFELSLHFFFVNQLNEAEERLLRLLDQMPMQVDALALLGHVQDKQGRATEALATAEKALQISPGHPFANTNYAIYMQKIGVRHIAEECLKKALKTAPQYPEALSVYARILAFYPEQAPKAMEMQKMAVQIEPDVDEYHINFCLTALQTGQLETLQREWAMHKKYIQAFTQHGSLRRIVGVVLSVSKDPLQDVAIAEMLNQNFFIETAKVFVQRAWQKWYKVEEEKKREFFYFLGFQASRCESHQIALDAFEKLSELEAVEGATNLLKAMAYDNLGKPDKAIQQLEQSELEEPQTIGLAADIYWNCGAPQQAISHLLRAAEMVSTDYATMLKGLKYSLVASDATSANKITELANASLSQPVQQSLFKAHQAMWSGDSTTCIQLLTQALYTDGKPSLPSLPEENRSQAISEYYEPYYLLGCAYIDSGNTAELKTLLSWFKLNLPDVSGEWQVLSAEVFRKEGHSKKALAELSDSNNCPPALLTRALCYDAENNSEAARAAINGILKRKDKGTFWFHPTGFVQNETQKLNIG